MAAKRLRATFVGFGAALAISGPVTVQGADAAPSRWSHGGGQAAAIHAGMSRAHYAHFGRWFPGYTPSSALQCVPFARENTGIELTGNAAAWWGQADGVYQRGAKPEVGSILNFRATGHMPMGHVAVVTNVLDSRHIQIDHANWGGPGAISRDIDVLDVSPDNDWTAVRVELGHSGGFGSEYPTYGFIYDRPDAGTMVANAGLTPATNATPTVQTVSADEPEEVAEAVDTPRPRYTRHRWYRTARTHVGEGRVHAVPRVAVYRVSGRSSAVQHQDRRHRS